MRKAGSIAATLILLLSAAAVVFSADSARGPKTALLSDKEIKALADEISGVIAKDTVTELARSHRVQASSGFARAAGYIASRAREYGLQNVQIEHFPADGQKTYYTLKSTPGWEVERAELWETSPNKAKVADYDEMRVALADYSQSADVVGQLIDVGAGASPFDYEGKEVRGKIVLAGGSVAAVHKLACDERGAAGVLSSMQNQVTAWSGDYVDNVRWGHLSPYNSSNKFAFMISLRQAREFRERLAAGQKITLHALVKAEMKPSNYDVVTAVIPGSDLAGEEIVFSCHLCHQKPGANDNASGAAAILEIARTLMTLINRGDIEKPRRTIRFIWPPEIAGTVAYLAFHPDIVSRMKAVIHLDMVGGDHAITKAVLHTTHTPASLPSCVNAVADVFTEYVIEGSQRAAAGGGFEDALISPEGSKESFFADMGPYTMGSDHDVYEEGTFRIPAIYLADWPDVFIHTNNDLPSNIDPTKIKRSSFIAAASGYFLARAGSADAARLADLVFARAMSRLPRINARAANLESRGREGASDEARSLISNSLETDAAALSSVTMLAPTDRSLEAKVEGLVDQLSGAWLLLTGQFSQQHKGNRIFFVLEPKEQPKPRDAKSKSRKDKEPAPAPSSPAARVIPVRKVLGPMDVYYYDYIADRASGEDLKPVEKLNAMPHGEIIRYEILNLVDGKRSVKDIHDYLTAAYGPLPVDDVMDYVRLLVKIGVLGLE
ncbi:MAG: hypothetical protein DMF61_27170 [Blastocatellia bacterium AA13]|nr:MAG: hypothetical protein DMF61_27170 [Blastocatellia bacterium AA13]